MSVTCQILINKPRSGIHKAGSSVSGLIKYTVKEPVKYKDIIVSLIGKGKCTWNETNRNNHTRRNVTIIYKGKEIYTLQHMSLLEQRPQVVFILPAGTYEKPFQFILPNDIPSSYNSKSCSCSIKYAIVIEFVRPAFSIGHKKFCKEFDVIGKVRPLAAEGVVTTKLDKSLFKIFSKRKHRIHVAVELPNSIYKPNDKIQINYKVTNDSDVIVPSLKAELVCRATYTADCGRRKERTKTIHQCSVESPSIPDNAVANLASTLQLPGYVYTIQNSRIVQTDYSVKVTLKLPMPHIDNSVTIPIVIGEKYGAEELQVPEVVLLEEPPSYFEVMNEEDYQDND